MGVLKGYKASIKLKENSHSSYFESCKLPIHILPLVVAKLKTMVEQGILEYFPLVVVIGLDPLSLYENQMDI